MILARNERLGNLEIDIIASYKGKMIFIEVKTRLKSETNNNDPMLYRRQIDNLKRAIVIYALKNRVSLDAVYLDLIIIEADHQTGCASLKHYPDII